MADQDKLYVPILVGTTRPERQTIHVAKLALEIGQTYPELEVELVDPVNFSFPGDGNDPGGKDPRYTEITKRADGFLIVTPEYNHSFPGSLKRMLDSELDNYIHKPVGFVSLSSQQWGGVRAIEALTLTVREMGMVSTFGDVQFPRVGELFDESGVLKDERYRKYVMGTFQELIWMTKVLKLGRQTVPSKYHQT